MRRTLITLVVLLAFGGIKAQYKTFVFGEYTYKTECHYNKNDFITIKIGMQSLDQYPIELMIGTQKEYNSFINRLNYLKVKMIEWDSTCAENNIGKIDKLIEFKVKKKEEPSVWFGKYYNSTLLLNAYARDNGKSKIIMHTGKVASLMNEYITCKGGVIIFNSPQEIDEMIKAFNLTAIKSYIDAKNNNLELLK